jgi:hypothetical protein
MNTSRASFRSRRGAIALGLALGFVALAGLAVAGGCRPEKVQEAIPGGNAIQEASPGGTADQAIKVTIETNLRTDPRTQGSQITVSVSGRLVTLAGQAATGEAKLAAVEIAKRTPSVTEVIDQLSVAPGGLP